MAYFQTKDGSLEESIRKAVSGIQEKKTEYVELEFKDKQAAINAFNTVNRKVYPGGMQPFSDMNQEGNTLQLDNVDNVKKVLADFKKVGKLKFKVAVQEKLVGGQKELDKDNDGDIDAKDFAMLRKDAKKEGKEKVSELTKAQEKLPPALQKAIKAKEKKEKKESYELGTPENTKSKLDATPGQSADDWQQQVDTMQKKNASMREALAKVWGMEEGRNPFADNPLPKKEEKKEKKETKTMTGKPMTKVTVDPEMKETKIGKKNVR